MPEGQVDVRKPPGEDYLPARSVSAKAGRKALPTGRQAYSGAKLDRRETN